MNVRLTYDEHLHGDLSTTLEQGSYGGWYITCAFTHRGYRYWCSYRTTAQVSEEWVLAQCAATREWSRVALDTVEWAGPQGHDFDGVPRAGGSGQWEPPHVVPVWWPVTGIDTDGRYETGRVESLNPRRVR